ncbi:MAG: signal peptidase I [Dehalococcoidia bacterium]
MQDIAGFAARLAARPAPNKRSVAFVALVFMFTVHLGLVAMLSNPQPYLVVDGTSMQPTYHQGDLLLSEKVSPGAVEKGDVLVFRVPPEARLRNSLPDSVAHRVIDINVSGGRIVFTTKGDNTVVDPFTVPSEAVDGRVAANVGRIGLPVLLATKISPKLLLFLIPVLVFVGVFALLMGWPAQGAPVPAKEPPRPVATDPRSLRRWAGYARLGLEPPETAGHRAPRTADD